MPSSSSQCSGLATRSPSRSRPVTSSVVDRRQFALLAEIFFVAGQRAFELHLGKQPLQRDFSAARNAERARNLALAGLALRGVDELNDLLLGRQPAVWRLARRGFDFLVSRGASVFLAKSVSVRLRPVDAMSASNRHPCAGGDTSKSGSLTSLDGSRLRRDDERGETGKPGDFQCDRTLASENVKVKRRNA